MTTKKLAEPKYSIARILSPEFTIRNMPFLLESENTARDFEVLTETAFGYLPQPSGGVVQCALNFSFRADKAEFIKMQVIIFFHIENFEKVVHQVEGKYDAPVEFKRMLFTITTGTARGILHAKTEGLALNMITIPILDAAINVPQ